MRFEPLEIESSFPTAPLFAGGRIEAVRGRANGRRRAGTADDDAGRPVARRVGVELAWRLGFPIARKERHQRPFRQTRIVHRIGRRGRSDFGRLGFSFGFLMNGFGLGNGCGYRLRYRCRCRFARNRLFGSGSRRSGRRCRRRRWRRYRLRSEIRDFGRHGQRRKRRRIHTQTGRGFAPAIRIARGLRRWCGDRRLGNDPCFTRRGRSFDGRLNFDGWLNLNRRLNIGSPASVPGSPRLEALRPSPRPLLPPAHWPPTSPCVAEDAPALPTARPSSRPRPERQAPRRQNAGSSSRPDAAKEYRQP